MKTTAHLMICLSVRFDATVHGSLILVMQRFAGQEEYAWYLRIQLVGIKYEIDVFHAYQHE